MSNISSTHAITLTSDFKPLSECRTSSHWFKLTESMKAKGLNKVSEPKSVSLPHLKLSEMDLELLKPHFVGFCESVQDKIVKSLIEAGKTEVSDLEISIYAIKEFLEKESVSSRLSSESIKSWFSTDLEEILTVSLADKLGISNTPTENETLKLNQLINVAKEKLATLSSPKVTFSEVHQNKLTEILNLAPESFMQEKLLSRISNMKIKEQDLLDLL